MSQCPSCNTELTQAEVETGSCPSCGNSLLVGGKTQEADAKTPLEDEQMQGTIGSAAQQRPKCTGEPMVPCNPQQRDLALPWPIKLTLAAGTKVWTKRWRRMTVKN